MKSLVRKWLMGTTIFSEYSKITSSGDPQQKAWMKKGESIIEISSTHWLLCIEPMIFGVWLNKNPSDNHNLDKEQYNIYFGGYFDKENNTIHTPESELVLSFMDCIDDTNGKLVLLRLNKCKIHHLGFIKRYLIFSRYYKRDRLTFDRFKCFVSAYSYPRRIRVVSFREDGYYNIFPMDLLGDISQHNRYVFGLRHTNLALQKIIKTGKLVVCEAPSKYKDTVYQLGKHHSGTPPPLESLSFQVSTSKQFGFYVPAWVESYKEIRILKTMNLGSHMLLWGEQLGNECTTNSSEHLFLVHFLHYLHQKNKGMGYTLA